MELADAKLYKESIDKVIKTFLVDNGHAKEGELTTEIAGQSVIIRSTSERFVGEIFSKAYPEDYSNFKNHQQILMPIPKMQTLNRAERRRLEKVKR